MSNKKEVLCEGCLPTLNGVEIGKACSVCDWRATERTTMNEQKPCHCCNETKPNDFAKIVRASNGQQVLFYKSVDDNVNVLHCIAHFGHYQADMKVEGIPDEAFDALMFDKLNTEMADKIIAQAEGF